MNQLRENSYDVCDDAKRRGDVLTLKITGVDSNISDTYGVRDNIT